MQACSWRDHIKYEIMQLKRSY